MREMANTLIPAASMAMTAALMDPRFRPVFANADGLLRVCELPDGFAVVLAAPVLAALLVALSAAPELGDVSG